MHHYAKIFTIFVTAVFASEYNVEINDATQFKTMSNEDLLCMCNAQGVYRLQDVESLCFKIQENFFFQSMYILSQLETSKIHFLRAN